MNEIIHLLRIEEEDNSHYVYIKNFAHVGHISNCSCDKGKEFCPICKKKVLHADFTKHLSSCLKFHKDGTFIKLPECVDECKPCMSFKNHKNKLERPYVVYADIEATVAPYKHKRKRNAKGEIDAKGEKVAQHKPNSAYIFWYVPMIAAKIRDG